MHATSGGQAALTIYHHGSSFYNSSLCVTDVHNHEDIDFCHQLRALSESCAKRPRYRITGASLAEDAKDVNTFPETLRKHIAGISANCELVLIEAQRLVEKYDGPGVIKSSKWALEGSEDVAKLRLSLEAHKSALEIALEMVTLSMTRQIKTDTSNLRDDTAAIKHDTADILREIARLRAQLPCDLATLRPSAQEPSTTLIRYLDDLTSYAETVCWSGADSDTDAEDINDAGTRRPGTQQRVTPKAGQSPPNTKTSTEGARYPHQEHDVPLNAQGTHLPTHTPPASSPRFGADEFLDVGIEVYDVKPKPQCTRKERIGTPSAFFRWAAGAQGARRARLLLRTSDIQL